MIEKSQEEMRIKGRKTAARREKWVTTQDSKAYQANKATQDSKASQASLATQDSQEEYMERKINIKEEEIKIEVKDSHQPEGEEYFEEENPIKKEEPQDLTIEQVRSISLTEYESIPPYSLKVALKKLVTKTLEEYSANLEQVWATEMEQTINRGNQQPPGSWYSPQKVICPMDIDWETTKPEMGLGDLGELKTEP